MNGLILMGGESVRMGTPKHALIYHEKPQFAHLYALLQPFCDAVWLSGKPTQADFVQNLPFLADAFDNIGAMGGVLTAFQHAPDTTWLVVGCDFPFVDAETISFLIKNQNHSKNATLFEECSFLQPLLAIYEPSIFPFLQNAIYEKSYSLRILLESLPIQRLHSPNEQWLMNANTPSERDTALVALRSKP